MKRKKRPAIVAFLRLMGWLVIVGTVAFLGLFLLALPDIWAHIKNMGSAFSPAYTLAAIGGGALAVMGGILLGLALLSVASVIAHLNDVKRLLAYQARALGSM